LLVAVGAYVVAHGEVKMVLVFDIEDVAKALVQLEWLSVASWKTSAQYAQVLEVEEVFHAHILRLLLGSFSLIGEGCLARAHPWNMGDIGLCPLIDLVCGGSYESSCDPPQ
jgi:hypothetical protein